MKKYKPQIISFLILAPFIIHCFEAAYSLVKNYNGEHCLGLIGVQWQCTEFEYFNNIAFSELGIYYLLSKYIGLAILAICFIAITSLHSKNAQKT